MRKKWLAEDNESILGKPWQKSIERYSKLGRSVSSDSLPALTGHANIREEHRKDAYIAGHWEISFIRSLL